MKARATAQRWLVEAGGDNQVESSASSADFAENASGRSLLVNDPSVRGSMEGDCYHPDSLLDLNLRATYGAATGRFMLPGCAPALKGVLGHLGVDREFARVLCV